MKIFAFTAALAACLATPALAQNWGGSGGVTTPLTTADGVIQFGTPAVGTVEPFEPICAVPDATNPNGYLNQNRVCSDAEVAAGAIREDGPVLYDNNGNYLGSSAHAVTSLPATIADPLSQVRVMVNGVFPDPSSPSGVSLFNGSIPLSAFAAAGSNVSVGNYQGQIDTLSGRVDTLETRVDSLSAKIDAFTAQLQAYNAQQQALAEKLDRNYVTANRGIAMASALSQIAPIDGASNRLALGVGTYANQSAMSVNYSHKGHGVDVGVSAAFSGNQTLAKGAIGINW